MGHDSVESDLCGSQEPKGILEVNQCTVNSTSPQSPVQSSVRLRNKRCNDPNRSLHRQIVEHNWSTRLENGLHSSNGCSPSSALSLMASDGPDSPLDNTHPVLHDSKTPLEESTSRSNSVVSSPAISDRLRLASLKVPTVALNELPASIPVSSRSTSPHTPSSASSSSTLGYFFDRMSHSEDDDQMEADHRLPLPSSRGTSEHDLPCRRRSKRNSKHANWWHWGSARRGKPKRPRRDPLPVNTSQANSTTTVTTTTNTVSVRNANLPRCGRQSFWDSNGQSKSARTEFSSTYTTDQKESVVVQNSSDAPRFTLSERTLFTLGSSANTWLGMGAARGRIYTKHPELFRYQCDAEDKAWLVRNGLLASHGVKAYLMHSDQVKYIGLLNGRVPSPSPSVKDKQVDSLPSFTLPAWLVLKVIDIASNHRDFAVEPISVASHGHPTSRILPDGSASITRIDSHGDKKSNGTTEHFCRHDNSGLNINSSSSKCTSVQPYLPQSLSDHSGPSKSNDIRQQLSENSNSAGGESFRLDCDDDDRVTESRKTSGNHIERHQWHDLRHKTDMNVPTGASSSDVQTLSCASYGAKSARSCSKFDSQYADKSPKSPPTLQRFDYT
ncbi:Deoxynucleotidyltransferase terminal-interacting protein 1 [Fasciola gigantica]|uniref:Deoxynucleotidyltransferase terminal-interacting protein 1 n=1 Tax=Fasciola gigantica TaxID=46835 RepID=A0A504Z0P3_FASGI|nr:Deoxynucleotidyltransferase terminal-interacting protein 1 [Fasciola gigantica]